MNSLTNHKIKKRESPNDVFITPPQLAKNQIDMIDANENDIWFDPFKHYTGNYYNQFPTDNKRWCEILLGRDFFDFNEHVDIVVSNPPYSIIDKIIDKLIDLNPRIISLLIGQSNLTCKRIEKLNKAGYGLYKLHFTKVYSWFGISTIVQFEKDKPNCIQYDRIVWK